MEFFSCFACCGKRNKNQPLVNGGAYPLNDYSVLKSKKINALFYDFEEKLSELKTIPINEFIKEAKLLGSYDHSLST